MAFANCRILILQCLLRYALFSEAFGFFIVRYEVNSNLNIPQLSTVLK